MSGGSSCCRSCWRRCWCKRSCSCWRRRWCSTWQYRVALRADGCTPNAVAEILSKDGVVLLHSRCGAGVALLHRTVDHIEAALPFVQPQLKVGRLGAVAQICCAPFNVEDTIWRTARYRGEDTAGTTRETRAASLRIGLQVVPIGHDGIIVRNPRKTKISPGCIGGRELRVAVGRQINAGKALVVQGEGEWQRHGGNCIICVIADIQSCPGRYCRLSEL